MVVLGRYAEADAELALGSASFGERYRGIAYARSGRRGEAIHLAEELEMRANKGYVSPATRGVIWLALGEKDRGYALLDDPCARKDWRLRDMKIHPIFEPFLSEACFHGVLRCARLE